MNEHKYSEEDVRAACFYTGVALEAKKKGIAPIEMFIIRYGDHPEEAGGKYTRGADLSLGGASLMLSPKFFDTQDYREALEEWTDLFGRHACSPIVTMELSQPLPALKLLGQVLGSPGVFYLAALA